MELRKGLFLLIINLGKVLYMSMYTASQLDLLHTQTHTGVLVIYQPNKCGMYVVGKRNILSPFFITAHLREF